MSDADSRLREAWALHRQGQLDAAERLYRDVLTFHPDHPDALHFLGVIEAQRGHYATAAESMARSLGLKPGNVAALFNYGNALRALHRLEEAVQCYERALALNPDHRGALAGVAGLRYELGRYSDAAAAFARLSSLAPGNVESDIGLGNALVESGRSEEALSAFDRALRAAPRHAGAWFGRGNALIRLNRIEDALTSYDRALVLEPGNARIHNNRGNVLGRLHRLDEAVASFTQAIAADPNAADAYNNRGNILMQLRRPLEALADYDRAIGLRASDPRALYGRGSALLELNRHDEAISAFEDLLRLQPDYPYGLGMLVHALRTACHWRDESAVQTMIDAVRAGRRATTPMVLLSVSDDLADKLACSRAVMRDKFPSAPAPLSASAPGHHDRIRVAYLSADFREHAVAILMAGVFEHHDRARFETIAVSHGPDDRSALRARLKTAFDCFIDVRDQSDFQVASCLKQMAVDIAVDLTGFTGSGRPGILVWRPCPIQVNYLGFAGSMGSGLYDYLIGDAIIIPETHDHAYAEKIVRLPHAYLPHDSKRAIAEPPSRQAAGLPPSDFVFASFNNSYKFSRPVFDIWMRLLKTVDDSVLWLSGPNPAAGRNLKREAAARGVEPERIIFAPYEPSQDRHLARLSLADLFLDTFPYNAHTTAMDALWAGLPVLTVKGESFASRVAASLLTAAGLEELIADSLPAYERIARSLAEDPQTLAGLKDRLKVHQATCPLFDTARFTRNLESAYIEMVERQRQGDKPSSFTVVETRWRPRP